MFNSDLKALGIAIIAVGTFSFSTVSAQTLLFQDDFDAGDTTQVDQVSNPSSRGNGSLQGDIHYQVRVGGTEFNGGSFSSTEPELRIHNNALDFSAGLEVNGTTGQTAALFDDRFVRFEDSDGGEYNWGPELGDHYEISFQLHATYNSPLAFSISDTVTTGRYNPHAYSPGTSPYDFGMNTWTDQWNLGEDGNAQTGITGATAGDSFHVRVLIDERNPQATASVFIDGSASALHTFDIDFENNERYFQFNGRTGYGGTLDDLQINSYAVPEPSNSTLLILLLITGIYAYKRQ